MYSYWFSQQQYWQLPPSRHWRDWLLYKQSMTIKMQKKLRAQVSVNVIEQAWGVPLLDEQQFLLLQPTRYCLIREVELCAANQVLMYARSVMPQGELTKQYQKLPNLKNKTIGRWFFAKPDLHRSHFEFQCLQPTQALFAKAVQQVNQSVESLWARRSLFTTHSQQMLLTEIFLPELINAK